MLKEKMKRSYLPRNIWYLIISFIFAFILLFILDYYDIPSRLGLFSYSDSKVWLQFSLTATISIISAILGFCATIFAVKLTISDQEKVRSHDNRIAVLPLLDISKENLDYDYRNNYIQFDFVFTEESKNREPKDIPDTSNVTISLKNVGQRELYDLHITNVKSTFFKERVINSTHKLNKMIYKNQDLLINFMFYELGTYDNDTFDEKYNLLISPLTFDCFFKDCYSNWYKQSLSITLFHKINKNTPLNERALDVSVSNGNVLSPPILLDSEPDFLINDYNMIHH